MLKTIKVNRKCTFRNSISESALSSAVYDFDGSNVVAYEKWARKWMAVIGSCLVAAAAEFSCFPSTSQAGSYFENLFNGETLKPTAIHTSHHPRRGGRCQIQPIMQRPFQTFSRQQYFKFPALKWTFQNSIFQLLNSAKKSCSQLRSAGRTGTNKIRFTLILSSAHPPGKEALRAPSSGGFLFELSCRSPAVPWRQPLVS